MILRPHHLFCTQAYEGMGYNKEFVINMDKYIKLLREQEGYKITLKTTLDSLCVTCPHNKGIVCATQEKVMTMDKKILSHFKLDEGIYIYEEVINHIKSIVTKEIFDDICGNCEWHKYGSCEKLILKK
ncbi:MAG: DUF1284 domain-containing protein [Sarcina sp.]